SDYSEQRRRSSIETISRVCRAKGLQVYRCGGRECGERFRTFRRGTTKGRRLYGRPSGRRVGLQDRFGNSEPSERILVSRRYRVHHTEPSARSTERGLDEGTTWRPNERAGTGGHGDQV